MAKPWSRTRGKRRGKSKGSKGRKGPKKRPIADGLKPSEMSSAQLLAFVKRMFAEKEREVQEMNMFMLEKRKLWDLWTLLVGKNKILFDEAEAEMIAKEAAQREKDTEEALQTEKLRHLQAEELRNFAAIRLNHLNYMRTVSDETWEMANVLRESAIYKRMAVRQQLEAHFAALRALHSEHSRKVEDTMVQLSKAMFNKEMEWSRIFESQREIQTAAITTNDPEIAQRKMDNMNYMDEHHERMLLELQTYFNDLTANNFIVIDNLQKEVARAKQLNQRSSRELRRVQEEHQALVGPMQQMEADLESWKDDDLMLAQLMAEDMRARARLAELQKIEKYTEFSVETLKQQLELEMEQKDKLEKAYKTQAMKVQRRTSMQKIMAQLTEGAARQDIELVKDIGYAVGGNSQPCSNYIMKLHQEAQNAERAARRRASRRLCVSKEAMKNHGKLGNGPLPPLMKNAWPEAEVMFKGRAQDTYTRLGTCTEICGAQLQNLLTTPVKQLAYGMCQHGKSLYLPPNLKACDDAEDVNERLRRITEGQRASAAQYLKKVAAFGTNELASVLRSVHASGAPSTGGNGVTSIESLKSNDDCICCKLVS